MRRGDGAITTGKVQAENRGRAKKVVAEKDQLRNRNLTRAACTIPPATDEEVLEVSRRLNASIDELAEAGDVFTPMKLFKLVDNDASGQIGWEEFEWLCRNELSLSQAKLPLARLQAVWFAFDADQTGCGRSC